MTPFFHDALRDTIIVTGVIIAALLLVVALVVFLAAYLAERKELLATATYRAGPFLLPEIKYFMPLMLAWAVSLFVLFFVFFSWIEGRALAQALGHRAGPPPGPIARWLRKKLRADLGAMPPVPWLPAALLVFLPFALLLAGAPLAGIAMLLIAVAMPIVYARLDAS